MSRFSNSGRSQHPTPIYRQNIQKNINKYILELNNTVDEKDLIDFFRVFHPMVADYTFF
jgi:hypothetical protein